MYEKNDHQSLWDEVKILDRKRLDSEMSEGISTYARLFRYKYHAKVVNKENDSKASVATVRKEVDMNASVTAPSRKDHYF